MTCAKRHVAAYLMREDRIVAAGTNKCRAPQRACPREPGEDYTKCRTVCDQEAHAEVAAIWNAAKRGIDLSEPDHGFRMVVVGHHRCCDFCRGVCDSNDLPVSFA